MTTRGVASSHARSTRSIPRIVQSLIDSSLTITGVLCDFVALIVAFNGTFDQARSQTMPIGGATKILGGGAIVTSHRTQLTLQSLTAPLL